MAKRVFQTPTLTRGSNEPPTEEVHLSKDYAELVEEGNNFVDNVDVITREESVDEYIGSVTNDDGVGDEDVRSSTRGIVAPNVGMLIQHSARFIHDSGDVSNKSQSISETEPTQPVFMPAGDTAGKDGDGGNLEVEKKDQHTEEDILDDSDTAQDNQSTSNEPLNQPEMLTSALPDEPDIIEVDNKDYHREDIEAEVDVHQSENGDEFVEDDDTAKNSNQDSEHDSEFGNSIIGSETDQVSDCAWEEDHEVLNPVVTNVKRQIKEQIETLREELSNRKEDTLGEPGYLSMFRHVEKAGVHTNITQNLQRILMNTRGKEMNRQDYQGNTVLHYAAKDEYVRIVDILMDFQPDLSIRNNDYKTAIDVACLNGQFDAIMHILERLNDPGLVLNRQDPNGMAPLHRAVMSGSLKTVALLLEKGADPAYTGSGHWNKTSLHEAAKRGHTEIGELILSSRPQLLHQKDDFGYSACQLAAMEGHVAFIEAVLAREDSRSDRRMSILATVLGEELGDQLTIDELASSVSELISNNLGNVVKKIELLLAIVPDVNINAVNEDGWTALHEVVKTGNVPALHFLLVRGGDLNHSNQGTTPLHLLMKQRHVNVVPMTNLMLRFCQDRSQYVNSQDSHGKTALHFASSRGSIECVEILLSAGADSDVQCNMGMAPIHEAVIGSSENAVEVIEQLQTAGAELEMIDYDGSAPVHYAAKQADARIMKGLIDNGACSLSRDKLEQTPLHVLVVDKDNNNTEELVKILVPCPGDKSINEVDSDGLTALHRAAMLKKVDVMSVLLNHRADAVLKCGKWQETPIEMLYHNTLVKFVANDPVTSDLNVAGKLGKADIVAASPHPVKTALHYSSVFKKISKLKKDQRESYEELADKMDELAVRLFNQCPGRISANTLIRDNDEYLLSYSLEYKHKKFISANFTQRYLREVWVGQMYDIYGSVHSSKIRLYGFLYVMTPIILPIAMLLYLCCLPFYKWSQKNKRKRGIQRSVRAEDIRRRSSIDDIDFHPNRRCCRGRCRRDCCTGYCKGSCCKCIYNNVTNYFYFVFVVSKNCPYMLFYANLVSYLVFLVLLLIKCVTHTDYYSIESLPVVDYFLSVFIVGYFVEEIKQFIESPSYKEYFSSMANVFDVVMLTCLTAIMAFDIVIIAVGIGLEQNELAVSASIGIALVTLIAFFRLMLFLQASHGVGLLQLTFARMFYDVGQLFIFLLIGLLAFSLSIIKVYSLLSGTYNGEIGSGPDESVSNNTQARYDIGGAVLFAQIEDLFWTLFGLGDIDSFDTDFRPVETIGKILFGLYNLLAVVVILNMLIAKMSDTYNRIEKFQVTKGGEEDNDNLKALPWQRDSKMVENSGWLQRRTTPFHNHAKTVKQ
uniref:Uncharacterized protein LOC102803298 n=1 Tax=Saccoglossus kowalevskii TaxID=10224 RepID=A0ABM0M672_SACKO|nr:PREDICTED: uncharacterized protein LOC102803298 [Saccoglossus kowalevskii]